MQQGSAPTTNKGKRLILATSVLLHSLTLFMHRNALFRKEKQDVTFCVLTGKGSRAKTS